MLTKKQIQEIREHLEKAQNPFFLFDNDVDGLCSFLLLQRFIGRGKGFPIKSFPSLSVDYIKRIKELNADYIFILDKPTVSKEFFEEVEKVNLPVVWIDHHDIPGNYVPDFVNYYNPILNLDKKNEPTTALCYSVTEKKEDLWLAVVGCISDRFLPNFYEDFKKEFPDLAFRGSENVIDAFDIFYKSEIGKIARIFSFALKDRVTNVVSMMKFLMKVKNPRDVLEMNKDNKLMHKRFTELDKKYKKILNKAIDFDFKSKILFFKYGGDMSISSEISNELSYLFPDKIIVVIYVNGIKVNISIRGKNVRGKALEAIKSLSNATGGGHEDAVGVTVSLEDLDKFKEKFSAGFT